MVSMPCVAPRLWLPPVAAGGVPGILQTVLRAEITAVIAACRFGVYHHKPFYVWTDCQDVFDRVQNMLSQENFSVTSRQKDHDLWQTLHTLVLRAKAMGLFQRILKVTSHQAHMEYSSLVDRWAIEGNEAADAAATWARTLLPAAVIHAYRRLQVESEQRYAACRAMHKLLVAIGSKVVAEKNTLKTKEEDAWERMEQQTPTAADRISFCSVTTGDC